MAEYELVVRVNGRHPAFSPVGRQAVRWPKVCTSVSVRVLRNGEVVLHALVDVGPGVWEAVLAEQFPPAFPLHWLLLTHPHADHYLSLDVLCGDRTRHWLKAGGQSVAPLPVHCLPDTYREVVGSRFPWLGSTLSHVPAVPGSPHVLWQADGGRPMLDVIFLEVVHYRQSAIPVFRFTDEASRVYRVVCLFDFGAFHPSGSPAALAGGRADNPLLFQPDLLIASANTWADHPTGHISFIRLADHLCEWLPTACGIVHYSGAEDIRSGDGPDAYWAAIREGRRIHPSAGPGTDWEVEAAIRRVLADRGYPDPQSVGLAVPGGAVVVTPACQPRGERLPAVERAGDEVRVCGAIDRAAAHRWGIPHTTVLLIPRLPPASAGSEGKILITRRPMSRSSGGKWDFAGGHCVLAGRALQPDTWSDPRLLPELALATAVREACEELVCDPAYYFVPADLAPLGATGEFTTGLTSEGRSGNVEYSSAYLVRIPPAHTVSVQDTDASGTHRQACEEVSLDELLHRYERSPDDFADGAGRILHRLMTDRRQGESSLERQLRQLLC